MRIHFIQHEVFEAPGAYLAWAEKQQHEVTFSQVYQQDLLPDEIDSVDVLIIMGGPQSPDSSPSEYPYFDAKAEIAFIRRCIDAGKAVVGICLGAQLIGEALLAKYEHSPQKEIGVFPMTLTAAGINDSKIAHFGSPLSVGHWHNDMPGLTPESEILASSAGCPRQIVRYTNLVYGFQCHMELTTEVVRLLIASEEDLLLQSQLHQFVQLPDVIQAYDYNEMNNKLHTFLDLLECAYRRSLVNK
ncbi:MULTISPECIES: glutamine amidotransferase-related protein [Sphingobacterium]|jgi:GMP synthase (glutamine-hydrolysing)|uniref:glutamine amidotransferase-related protein n=1 Tax=Sphingobacterium TaxID=28453 RepID=UPI00257ACDD9|nr:MULTISPECIES: glutamine amidotransferase [Sphingobacterium]